MYHPPDLNLASSYIPACLCLFKCTVAFALFIASPLRGWIGLCCLGVVDRLLWNNSQTTILDVNSVAMSLVGGLMVMHVRASGVHSIMHMAVFVVWVLASIPQIVGASKLHRSYEVILAACCVAMLSCMFQAQERTEMLAFRAFVFVVINIALPYIGILVQQYETDTYVNVCRTLMILLGEPEVACFWVVVYALCIGYHIRLTKRKDDFTNPSSLEDQLSYSIQSAKSAPILPSMPSQTAEDPASLLREALASRRGGFARDV